MKAAFLRAAIPEPFTILGVRLKPFCLGHYWTLDRFECAFVTGKSPGFDDLIFGILVCSQSYEDGLGILQSDDLPKILKKWGKKVGKFDFAEKAGLFIKYINAGTLGPRFLAPLEGGKSETPWPELVRLSLMAELNVTATEVMNQPLGLSLWDFTCLAEIKGKVRLEPEGLNFKELREKAQAYAREGG